MFSCSYTYPFHTTYRKVDTHVWGWTPTVLCTPWESLTNSWLDLLSVKHFDVNSAGFKYRLTFAEFQCATPFYWLPRFEHVTFSPTTLPCLTKLTKTCFKRIIFVPKIKLKKKEGEISMNSIAEKKYIGDGGNAHRIFIQDAQVGWKHILNDPNRHVSNGVSQYEYLESLLNRLGGQACRLLDNS